MALGLVSFVLLLLLGLTAFATVEISNATLAKNQLLARENARLGAMVALGELQKHAGPDQRVTARAEADSNSTDATAKWSGVYDSSSGTAQTPVWLVSGRNPDITAAPDDNHDHLLFPAVNGGDVISVERKYIQDEANRVGDYFAYWTEEQNVKARINRKNETERMDFLNGPEERQDIAESLLLFPAQDKIFSEFAGTRRGRDGPSQPIEQSTVETIARIHTADQLGLAFSDPADVPDALAERRHDFSVVSMSVLENPQLGGLKVNLTGRSREDLDDLLDDPAFENDRYLAGDYLEFFNINPASGVAYPRNANANNPQLEGSSFNANSELVRIPPKDFYGYRSASVDADDEKFEPVRTVMPIVSEVSFRLGAFHTQTDKKHRIRFHADVEFWNPYPFPIRMPSESQNRAFVIMMLPSELGEPGADATPEQLILSIQKMGAGRGRGGGVVEEELHTNLFDFDEDLGSVLGGGATNNSINETVMSSWMVIDDVVLQPGEVYHATTEKPDGLARDLGGYILRSGGDPENAADYIPDPNHDYHKWSWHTTADPQYPVLEPDDEIRINLRMPENGLTFRLIAFDSASTSNSPVFEDDTGKTWATPLWELRNIYRVPNPPTLTLRGDEYSRYSSPGYTLNHYNIGFHFRLADELITGSDPDAGDLALRFDLRQPVWDYEADAVKRVVDITDENPFAVSQLANLYDGTDVIADHKEDSHSGGYEQVFLYNFPQREPLSVGTLHRLPLSYETVDFDADGDGTDEPVQLSVGSPWSDELNEAFDKYFYTGAPNLGWENHQPLPVSPLLPRGETTAARMREADAAADLLLEGGFNVNSLSKKAWSAMLSRTLHGWRYGTNDITDLKNAFTNLGDSTDLAIESVGQLEDDSTLTDFNPSDLSAAETAGRLAMRQPLRRLSDQQIEDLADALVERIQDFVSTNAPFSTVKEFANSAVLHDAIRDAAINGNIPDFSPAYISQSLILEMLAPYLTVRSDSFVIHAVGTSANSAGGNLVSTARCEVVVQRLPDRVDGDASRISEVATSNDNTFGRQFRILRFNWSDDEI